MRVLLGALVLILVGFLRPAESLRPLRERLSAAGSWSDEVTVFNCCPFHFFFKVIFSVKFLCRFAD